MVLTFLKTLNANMGFGKETIRCYELLLCQDILKEILRSFSPRVQYEEDIIEFVMKLIAYAYTRFKDYNIYLLLRLNNDNRALTVESLVNRAKQRMSSDYNPNHNNIVPLETLNRYTLTHTYQTDCKTKNKSYYMADIDDIFDTVTSLKRDISEIPSYLRRLMVSLDIDDILKSKSDKLYFFLVNDTLSSLYHSIDKCLWFAGINHVDAYDNFVLSSKNKVQTYLIVEKNVWLYLTSTWLIRMNSKIPVYPILIKHWCSRTNDEPMDCARRVNVLKVIVNWLDCAWLKNKNIKGKRNHLSYQCTESAALYSDLFFIINRFNKVKKEKDDNAAIYKSCGNPYRKLSKLDATTNHNHNSFSPLMEHMKDSYDNYATHYNHHDFLRAVRDFILLDKHHVIKLSTVEYFNHLLKKPTSKLLRESFERTVIVISDLFDLTPRIYDVASKEPYVSLYDYRKQAVISEHYNDGAGFKKNDPFQAALLKEFNDGYVNYAKKFKPSLLDKSGEALKKYSDISKFIAASQDPYIKKKAKQDLIDLYSFCASPLLNDEDSALLFTSIAISSKKLVEDDDNTLNSYISINLKPHHVPIPFNPRTTPGGGVSYRKTYKRDRELRRARAAAQEQCNSFMLNDVNERSTPPDQCFASKSENVSYLWNDKKLIRDCYIDTYPLYEDVADSTAFFLCVVEYVALTGDPSSIHKILLPPTTSIASMDTELNSEVIMAQNDKDFIAIDDLLNSKTAALTINESKSTRSSAKVDCNNEARAVDTSYSNVQCEISATSKYTPIEGKSNRKHNIRFDDKFVLGYHKILNPALNDVEDLSLRNIDKIYHILRAQYHVNYESLTCEVLNSGLHRKHYPNTMEAHIIPIQQEINHKRRSLDLNHHQITNSVHITSQAPPPPPSTSLASTHSQLRAKRPLKFHIKDHNNDNSLTHMSKKIKLK